MADRAFRMRSDLENPLRLMAITEREALWRYLTHVVDHAALDPDWASALADVDASGVPAETIALLRAVIDDNGGDVPVPNGLARRLASAVPAEPAIALRADPCGLVAYERWGFLL